jgi:hypothetical protein
MAARSAGALERVGDFVANVITRRKPTVRVEQPELEQPFPARADRRHLLRPP